MKRAAVLLVLAACHAQPPHAIRPVSSVTLYRDVALVEQRFELRLPAAPTAVTVQLAGGATQISLVATDGVTVRALHVIGPVELANPGSDDDIPLDGEATSAPEDPAANAGVLAPTSVMLDVTAPHAGTYEVTLVYATHHLQWDADYTITTTPARDRAILRGALAVRNTTGHDFENASIHVIDTDLANWRTHSAEHLGAKLTGAIPSTTPVASSRSLGIATLIRGETRVEITAISSPRPMHAVLVYDPIGTKLDSVAAEPSREVNLGAEPPAPFKVSESFEIQRPPAGIMPERGFAGLPAGPVRLFERRPDGSLGVLGEARMFDAATRMAEVDTIAVGAAEGVTGHRERRELTIDEARKKVTEEFLITLDNRRDAPVGVLVREHMYRGLNWSLAYDSTKRSAQEGAQQISLRTSVEAKSQQKILYVVVYTWTR